MSDEKRIEVTDENALKLGVGLLDVIVQQNKVIITKLSEMYGVLSKIGSVDLGVPNGTSDDGK